MGYLTGLGLVLGLGKLSDDDKAEGTSNKNAALASSIW